MNNEEIKNYLLNDENGKNLWSEMTAKLRSNKDTILTEKRAIKEENEKLRNEYTMLQEQMSGLKNSWEAEKAQRKTDAIKNGTDSLFKSANIAPSGFDEVKAILQMKGDSITLDEESGVLMLGENSLKDSLKEWQETETGKRFTLAPYNTGGGAIGSSWGSGRDTPVNPQSMTTDQLKMAIKTAK